MSKMSVGRKTASYLATAGLLSALIIVASTFYIGAPPLSQPTGTGPTSRSSGSTLLAGPRSLLVIQLTDPPRVPPATRSLNLTYSALSLLVGVPDSSGRLTPTTVGVTPSGGSATLDLLTLQKVSQTIATANLPNGSVLYSVAFSVSKIVIDVNGTKSPVALAAGGGTFLATMSQPSSLVGENVALLELNPMAVGTPSGYQLIPSAVGVIRHSQGQGQEQVGSSHPLTQQEQGELQHAQGNMTANLTALSVSGNSTTITVQVKNSGSTAMTVNAIVLHGNLTVINALCTGSITTGTTAANGSQTATGQEHHCKVPEHQSEIVFVPSQSTSTAGTTTSAACASAQLTSPNGDDHGGGGIGYVLGEGQCAEFTFTGPIAYGKSGSLLAPSTAPGQKYEVVVASNGTDLHLSCVLPLVATSCVVTSNQSGG
jgi:hypothetical protein